MRPEMDGVANRTRSRSSCPEARMTAGHSAAEAKTAAASRTDAAKFVRGQARGSDQSRTLLLSLR
jgi:hypothetical protein